MRFANFSIFFVFFNRLSLRFSQSMPIFAARTLCENALMIDTMIPNEVKEISMAMVALNVEKVKTMLASSVFDATIAYEPGFKELNLPSHPFVTIPIAWDWFVGNPDEWSVPERGKELKLRNEEIKELISSFLNVTYNDVPIEDLPHWGWFESFTAEERYEYIDKDEAQELRLNGFRQLDIDLFNAANCYDFELVKALLEKGANPDVKFFEFDSITETLAIRSSCYFCDLDYHYVDKNDGSYDDDSILNSLLYGAINERMWRFMNENKNH